MIRNWRTRSQCAIVVALSLSGAAGLAQDAAPRTEAPQEWSRQCEAMAQEDFASLADAPTRLTTARLVEASAELPAHCQLSGYVSPQVGFLLALPADGWNGKLLQLGCGGECGADVASYEAACSGPLKRGYACIGSNTGHTGEGGLWAHDNLQAQVDFGYRAVHVTALAAKNLIERYYSKAPKYSYFMGCSTGGRQALVAAQRFPWDFDGIVSGAPWINDTDSAMNLVWAYRALTDTDGKAIVSRQHLRLVHDAVLARCDRDDGVKDGVIGNPAQCGLRPDELLCGPGAKDRCLTQAQVEAVKKVYSGPVNSKGEKTYPGGAELGSEMGWVDDDGMVDYVHDNSPGGGVGWATTYFRHLVMPASGSGWQLKDFDFDRDHQRFGGGVHESLLNAANPDLRKFKAAGGKLIIYQGWNDQSDVPAMTIDYYQTVERTMGGRKATQDFARLFMVPGMLHCGGGDGAYAVDYLTHLEKWVEHGEAPDKMIGAHVDDAYVARLGGGSFDATNWDESRLSRLLGAWSLKFPLASDVPVTFTRPIYPYPRWARYKGSGSPNDASNFVPVDP